MNPIERPINSPMTAEKMSILKSKKGLIDEFIINCFNLLQNVIT